MGTELVVFYDDATGERVGLTAPELGIWTAATAHLLTGECGLGRGSRAGVLLPPHWQTAAVLLGAWAAGIEVSFRGWATAGLGPDTGPALDVTFVERRRVGSWLEDVPPARHQFVLNLGAGVPGSGATEAASEVAGATDAPSGATGPPSEVAGSAVPAGYREFTQAVRPHLGAPPPVGGVEAGSAATVDGTTFGEYGEVAAELARARGIGAGDRVLFDTAVQEEPLIWLMAPLTAGASIVLCANLDRALLDERVAAEGVSRLVL